ncbi:MAG: hypothetical protein ACFFD4_05625 [Candidatus Odinarchaeota archaeon]
MTLVDAFILPHGSLVLNPSREDIKKLHNAMLEVASEIKNAEPDLIFLTTPHGISLNNDFGIYRNVAGSGSAEWEGEYEEFSVSVEFDQEVASSLLNYFNERNVNASGVTCFTTSANAVFRWGEAVPLWFIKNVDAKYVVMSQPTRRYDQALSMIPELLELGKYLGNYLESLKQRVIAIISADLAHTHDINGPYGYSEIAAEFDQSVEEWAGTLDKKTLFEKTASMLDEALCCGFVGLVILQGMLDGRKVNKKVLARENPTYYGMLVASYLLER